MFGVGVEVGLFLLYLISFVTIMIIVGLHKRNKVIEVKSRQSISIIPRIIHQTHLTWDKMPPRMKQSCKALQTTCPDYKYRFYTDEQARTYIADHFEPSVLKAFDTLKPGSFKGDLFRYCVLYEEGGVYLDVGFSVLQPLDSILENHEMVTIVDCPRSVYQAFIGSIPKHPLMKACIARVLKHVSEKFYGGSFLHPTGPILVGDCFFDLWPRGHIQLGVDSESGIKFLEHDHKGGHTIGTVFYKNSKLPLMYTKYDGYRDDARWVYEHLGNGKKHYIPAWYARDIYEK